MGLAGIEIDHRHAALDAEVYVFDTRDSLKRLSQRGQAVVSQILNRNDCGFCLCHCAQFIERNSSAWGKEIYLPRGEKLWTDFPSIILDSATFGMRCRFITPAIATTFLLLRKSGFGGRNLTGGWPMPYDVPQLLKMSQAQLDELFTKSPVGDIPNGEGEGTAIVAPGTTYTKEIADCINHFG